MTIIDSTASKKFKVEAVGGKISKEKELEVFHRLLEILLKPKSEEPITTSKLLTTNKNT
jgi:hypothetical protein